jgi:hypothetical protein
VATPIEHRTPWAFWIAGGLSAVAGAQLLVVGGASSRIGGIVIPCAIAAIAFAACALLYGYGRTIATVLYFVASLAIVYGVLAMLTLPLRLAVIGTCPPAPAACTSGLEPPMTSGETSAMGFAIALGIAAILIGFFSLAALYRHETRAYPQPAPPTRRIAPVNTRSLAPPESVAPEPAAAAPPTPIETEPQPVPEPMLELTAPVEPLELPAVGTEDRPDDAAPAPARKPRRRRAPKTPASSTTPTTGDPD